MEFIYGVSFIESMTRERVVSVFGGVLLHMYMLVNHLTHRSVAFKSKVISLLAVDW